MQPLPHGLLNEESLQKALEEEAAYRRRWIPPEPWWAAVLDDKERVASSILRQLERGSHVPRADVIDVRKPGHGTRPVAILSPETRIVYRALAAALVPEAERVSRTADTYAEFVMEPIRAAFEGASGFQLIGDAKYSHIVATDIAAFYQYIDHAVLRDSFDIAGGDIHLIDALLELLGELQGRTFGIPQMLDPSDWISEYCAVRIESEIIREGFDVWRYSDDFRIGCLSYPEALRAIETLSRAARELGFVLNEEKTSAPSYFSYLMHNVVEVDATSVEIDPTDVEAAVLTDYGPDDEFVAAEQAAEVLDGLWEPESADANPPDDRWNVKKLTSAQHREVRRALNQLNKFQDPRALPKLLSLLVYQPAMTHQVVAYAASIAELSDGMLDEVFDTAIDRLSLGEWQRAWLAYGLRACKMAIPAGGNRSTWLTAQLSGRVGSLPGAEASITLAEAGLVAERSLQDYIVGASENLQAWYLHGLSLLAQSAEPSDRSAALGHESAIARAILRAP